MPFDFNSSPRKPVENNKHNNAEGFKQRPAIRNENNNYGNIRSASYYAGDSRRDLGTKAPRRPRVQHRSSVDFSSIPWGVILLIAGIIAIVALCWVYREAITAFLMEVLTWVIIILVIIFIFKWFIFGGRRR